MSDEKDFKDMQPQIDRILSQLERLNKLDKFTQIKEGHSDLRL